MSRVMIHWCLNFFEVHDTEKEDPILVIFGPQNIVLTNKSLLLNTQGMRESRNFFQGGPGPTVRKQSGQRFFFLVLNLFYSLQRGSNGFITERKLYFSKDPEGVQHFPGGGGGGGGSNANLNRNHITCDFHGGPDPLSPLWIHTCRASISA